MGDPRPRKYFNTKILQHKKFPVYGILIHWNLLFFLGILIQSLIHVLVSDYHSPQQRHRMVNTLLKEELNTGVHALSIQVRGGLHCQWGNTPLIVSCNLYNYCCRQELLSNGRRTVRYTSHRHASEDHEWHKHVSLIGCNVSFFIGASLSEPHTYVRFGDFVYNLYILLYIYLFFVRHSV